MDTYNLASRGITQKEFQIISKLHFEAPITKTGTHCDDIFLEYRRGTLCN